MDFLVNASDWLVVGVLLMLAEIIVPGGIVFFLGLASIIVAIAIWLGIVSSGTGALMSFIVGSMGLIIGLRGFMFRMAEGDSTKGNTIEILDDIDQVVTVISPIGRGDAEGLVCLRGSDWKAVGDGREIAAGESARIVSRENITLVVVPAEGDLP